jgi:hypothetical protein
MQSTDRKTLKRREKEIFDAWIERLIPDRSPDGNAFTVQEKADFLAYCNSLRRPAVSLLKTPSLLHEQVTPRANLPSLTVWICNIQPSHWLTAMFSIPETDIKRNVQSQRAAP